MKHRRPSRTTVQPGAIAGYTMVLAAFALTLGVRISQDLGSPAPAPAGAPDRAAEEPEPVALSESVAGPLGTPRTVEPSKSSEANPVCTTTNSPAPRATPSAPKPTATRTAQPAPQASRPAERHGHRAKPAKPQRGHGHGQQRGKKDDREGPITGFVEDRTGVDIPDGLLPFRTFLADVAREAPTIEQTGPDSFTAQAVITDDLAITAEITVPEEAPATIVVTPTDPETSAPLAAPVVATVEDPADVSGAAIGATVDAVTSVAPDEPMPQASSGESPSPAEATGQLTEGTTMTR